MEITDGFLLILDFEKNILACPVWYAGVLWFVVRTNLLLVLVQEVEHLLRYRCARFICLIVWHPFKYTQCFQELRNPLTFNAMHQNPAVFFSWCNAGKSSLSNILRIAIAASEIWFRLRWLSEEAVRVFTMRGPVISRVAWRSPLANHIPGLISFREITNPTKRALGRPSGVLEI